MQFSVLKPQLTFVLVVTHASNPYSLHRYCEYQSEKSEEEIVFPRREVSYLTGRCSSSNSFGD